MTITFLFVAISAASRAHLRAQRTPHRVLTGDEQDAASSSSRHWWQSFISPAKPAFDVPVTTQYPSPFPTTYPTPRRIITARPIAKLPLPPLYTRFPTSFPTPPTHGYTRYPTPFPTRKTRYPTPFPTRKTRYPTLFPTPISTTPTDGNCYSERNHDGDRELILADGDTTHDCGGRTCTCTGGTLHCDGAQCTVRREYGDLAQADKERFMAAWRWVHDNCRPTTSGGGGGAGPAPCGYFFDYHTNAPAASGPAGAPVPWDLHVMLKHHLDHSGHAHGGGKFLPWHRFYLKELEQRLQMYHACVTLPYWATHLDAGGNEAAARVYDAVLGDHDTVPPHLLPPHYSLPATFSSGALSRAGGAASFGFSDAGVLANLLARPSYASLRPALEATPHAAPHVFVGGHMGSFESPADPLFWLHHANVDKVWHDWQTLPGGAVSAARLATDYAPGPTTVHVSPQWGATEVADGMDSERDLKVCYQDPVGAEGAGAGGAGAAAAELRDVWTNDDDVGGGYGGSTLLWGYGGDYDYSSQVADIDPPLSDAGRASEPWPAPVWGGRKLPITTNGIIFTNGKQHRSGVTLAKHAKQPAVLVDRQNGRAGDSTSIIFTNGKQPQHGHVAIGSTPLLERNDDGRDRIDTNPFPRPAPAPQQQLGSGKGRGNGGDWPWLQPDAACKGALQASDLLARSGKHRKLPHIITFDTVIGDRNRQRRELPFGDPCPDCGHLSAIGRWAVVNGFELDEFLAADASLHPTCKRSVAIRKQICAEGTTFFPRRKQEKQFATCTAS